MTGEFVDVAGLCKSTMLAEIARHGHGLTPARYIGAAEVEDDGEPFAEKMSSRPRLRSSKPPSPPT